MLKKILKAGKKADFIGNGTNILSGLLFEGAVGQVAPGIISVLNSYKQKQYEERTTLALEEILQRSEVLDEKFEKLNKDVQEFVEYVAFPLMLENVVEEPEQEKVKYIVNAFENVIENGLTEKDLIIGYYDILKNLRLNEINRLIELTPEYRKEKYAERELTLNVDLSQRGQERRRFVDYIDNKLEQNGLMYPSIVVRQDGDDPIVGNSPITPFALDFLNFIKDNHRAN